VPIQCTKQHHEKQGNGKKGQHEFSVYRRTFLDALYDEAFTLI
jgi:hypothetical protein